MYGISQWRNLINASCFIWKLFFSTHQIYQNKTKDFGISQPISSITTYMVILNEAYKAERLDDWLDTSKY